MRNSIDIDKFCLRLNNAWQQVPNMRFGQFMCNVLSTCQARGKEMYYLEDEDFMVMVNAFLREVKLPITKTFEEFDNA